LINHSIVKYFSALSLPIHWIKTPNNLHQSKAGIGKTLNKANANDISPAKAKNCFHQPASKSISPNFTAHTGQLSLFNAQLIFVLSKETRFFHKFPSA